MKTKPGIRVKNVAFKEWLILCVVLAVFATSMLVLQTFSRTDRLAYDGFMYAHSHAPRDDIVIVGIDDFSLAELGRWPWPRARHAQLLQAISAANPKAIGLDIVFSEPEKNTEEGGDDILADAIKVSGKVVLPIILENTGRGLAPSLPLPKFAQAAKQLGHIHLELDNDGVARSVFLREGMNGEWFGHFSLAIKEVGTQSKDTFLPGSRLPLESRRQAATPGAWQRDYHMHIPYYGSRGHFRSVPYVAVLRGEVPATVFKDKYVLVGPTATAMADAYPTPVTGSEGVVPGIEINANILSSLLDHRSVEIIPLWGNIAISLAILFVALIALQFFTPRKALLTIILIALGTLIASALLLNYADIWFAPSSAIFCLLVAYPIWSWRRLEAAIKSVGEEFKLLDQEPHLLPELDLDENKKKPIADALEQNLQAMHVAAQRVRDLRQFISDSLNSLPDPTLVTTTDGNVLMTNIQAQQFFSSIGMHQVNDALLPYLFAKFSEPVNQPEGEEAFSWWNLLDVKHADTLAIGIEVRDEKGRDLLVKSAACYNADKVLTGWIVSVINITPVRAAERSRDETLHFLSHDMRAPQATILALIEMQREAKTALPNDEFVTRIEKSARITLGLAENFVQLARAEQREYRYEEADFQDILLVATEEMWSLAKSKRIKIVSEIMDDEYPVFVDRSLMTRVITNILSNAIKYSPEDTTVICRLQLEQGLADAKVVCSISDQGYGMTRADQSRLFQRYQRMSTQDQPYSDGIGMGMIFVKTVLDRHHAKIDFTSAPNEGTTFNIRIPADLT